MNKTPTFLQAGIMQLTITIITGLILWGIARGADKGDEINKKIDNKAEITFVNQKTSELKAEIDKKADKETIVQMKEMLNRIDDRVYKILEKTK